MTARHSHLVLATLLIPVGAILAGCQMATTAGPAISPVAAVARVNCGPRHHHCPTPSPSPTSTSPSPSPTSTSPSPSPTSTSPSPSPTSTSPSPSPTGTPCVTSADDGYCPGPGQFYDYPPVSASGVPYGPYIANNVWNHGALPSATQTLTAYDPGNWTAEADMADGNTAVISAPQVRQDFLVNGSPAPLSGYATITASASFDLHARAGTGAQGGYDVWTDPGSSVSFSQEMMIWTDTVNRGTCGGASPVASGIQFGTQTWDLCVNGPLASTSEFIWYLPGAQMPSGAVDILAMLRWMTGHGYYPAGTGLSQIDQTFEICSTGGQPETFSATGFTLTAR